MHTFNFGFISSSIYEKITMTSSKKMILIAGYFGFDNPGDEAILSVTLKNFKKLIPNAQFLVVSGNPIETKKIHHVNAINWTNISEITQAARKCDFIILGGGGLFHDYFKFNPDDILSKNHSGISFYTTFVFLATLFDKPLIINAVGVGPLLTNNGKLYTKISFLQSNIITVRDLESKEQLKKLGINGNDVFVTTDLSFNLDKYTQKNKIKKILKKEGISKFDKPILGVCLRNWSYNLDSNVWEENLAKSLDKFLDLHDFKIMFIPFQKLKSNLEDDISVAERIVSNMKHKENPVILKGHYTFDILSGIISICNFVVGMRLHSIIFSAINLIPFIGIIYDPKVKNILRQLNYEEYGIELSKINENNFNELLEKTIQNNKIITESLSISTKLKRKETIAQFNYILKLLKKKKTIPRLNDPKILDTFSKIVISNILKLDNEYENSNRLNAQAIQYADQIKQLSSEKSSLQNEISHLQNINLSNQKTISDKDSQIKELQQLSSDKDSEIKELQQLSSDKDSEIKELQQLSSDKDSEIKELTQLRQGL